MPIRSIRLAAFAFAASFLSACASSGGSAAGGAPRPTAEAKAAPSSAECTTCKVEVENRFSYQVLVFDRRDTRNDIGTITPIGRALPQTTVMVQTKGRPNLGMAVLQDLGVPPTAKGLVTCRQEAVRPGTGADYRYSCGQ